MSMNHNELIASLIHIDGISEEVVGKALDDLNVSRVAGSSLTSGGFNAAVDDIKEQAAA